MSDRTPAQVIDDVERRLARFDASYAYNGGYGPAAAARMADDMRALLDVAKRPVEPNVTIDLIHSQGGAIERITVAASSVRIKTCSGVRVEQATSPTPHRHNVVCVTTSSKMTMRASGDVAVVTNHPYTWEHIKPGEDREHR